MTPRHGLWKRWTRRDEETARQACAEIVAERETLRAPSADFLQQGGAAGDWAMASAAGAALVERQAALDGQLAERLSVWRTARTAVRQVLRVEQRQVDRDLRQARRRQEEGDLS